MGDLAVVLVVILILVLVWRGPKTLPRLGEALGRGVREARNQAGRPDDDADGPESPESRPTDGDRRT